MEQKELRARQVAVQEVRVLAAIDLKQRARLVARMQEWRRPVVAAFAKTPLMIERRRRRCKQGRSLLVGRRQNLFTSIGFGSDESKCIRTSAEPVAMTMRIVAHIRRVSVISSSLMARLFSPLSTGMHTG